jgi:hypothetical protein
MTPRLIAELAGRADRVAYIEYAVQYLPARNPALNYGMNLGIAFWTWIPASPGVRLWEEPGGY